MIGIIGLGFRIGIIGLGFFVVVFDYLDSKIGFDVRSVNDSLKF